MGLQRFIQVAFLVPVASLALDGAALAKLHRPSPRYRLHELSTLGPTSLWSLPHAINDKGQIAGMAHVPGDSLNRWWGVRWDGWVIQRLDPLPGSDLCWAYGINDSGDVTGACRTSDFPAGRAMLWSGPGHLVGPLETLGMVDSFASSINNKHVASGGLHVGGLNRRRAAVWYGSVPTFLGVLWGEDEFAWDVNDSGQAVGHALAPDGRSRAVRWTEGTPTQIGDVGSHAWSLNKRGDVAGYSAIPREGLLPLIVPTVWVSGVQRVLIQKAGQAYDINDSGWAVGTADLDGQSADTPFVFDGHEIYNLVTVIENTHRFAALRTAISINNKGAIVGWGTIGSQSRGFVLEPVHGSR